MAKGLTYEELIQLALDNYEKGGDTVYECWDKQQYQGYVDQFGPLTKTRAMKIFREYKAQFDDIANTAW